MGVCTSLFSGQFNTEEVKLISNQINMNSLVDPYFLISGRGRPFPIFIKTPLQINKTSRIFAQLLRLPVQLSPRTRSP